jgi:bile acid:Na+ symporter, BASS family
VERNIMNFLVDILLPLTVFFGMGVVGLGLTAEDFRRLASLRLGMVLGLVAPIVLLPLLAAGVARGLALSPALAGGLLVLAAAPPAAISNLYVALARANAALCVTLTAVSTLVAVVTMPLAMFLGFRGLALEGGSFRIPVLATMGQLVVLLIVPAGLGMAVRHWRPELAVKHLGGLRLLSLIAVLVPLFVVVWLQWEPFVALVQPVALAALVFTLASAAMGYGLGVLSGPSSGDRFALAANVSTRSFGLAATVGATFMGRTDFLAFVAAFFLTHAALAGTAILLFRSFCRSEPPPTPLHGKD